MDKIAAIKDFQEVAWSRDNEAKVAELYQSLTIEEGKQLVTYALELLDRHLNDQAEGILLRLACLTPGALEGFHQELIQRQVFYPGVIYREADPVSSEQLVNLVSDAQSDTNHLLLNHLLLALAWIGDKAAQQAFNAWRKVVPEWALTLYVPPEAYAQEAGWALMSEGKRRDLFHAQCYPLVKAKSRADYPKNPAKVVDKYEGNCPWCNHQLTTLFDLDLIHPQLRFLNIDGTRIRIVTCEVCTCYGLIYTGVDWAGKAEWSDYNQKPDFLPDVMEYESLPAQRLVLSEYSRNPFSAAHQFVPISFSQVGGHPTWIQDSGYPICPCCKSLMSFIAQLDRGDIEEYGEGIYYAFLCQSCRIACTSYQQS